MVVDASRDLIASRISSSSKGRVAPRLGSRTRGWRAPDASNLVCLNLTVSHHSVQPHLTCTYKMSSSLDSRVSGRRCLDSHSESVESAPLSRADSRASSLTGISLSRRIARIASASGGESIWGARSLICGAGAWNARRSAEIGCRAPRG